MSVMRIAVAGTGGLARLIAYYIREETSHNVILLSRSQKPQLTSAGYQVAVVDYGNADTLKFALRGVDTVVSTVTGPSQVDLIKAAVSVHVRRFAPAEFEGLPQLRAADDPLDRRRQLARQWLEFYAQHIHSTVFVCGILYERFQPGGLESIGIGRNSGIGGEGDYIMNCNTMTAQAPAWDSNNEPTVTICMTAAHDVARFVTRALDLRSWPPELRMCGHRVSIANLVADVQRMKGQPFTSVQWHGPASLNAELQVAMAQNDPARQLRLLALINTAAGAYDFGQPNLNVQFQDLRPTSFEEWFTRKWTVQQ